MYVHFLLLCLIAVCVLWSYTENLKMKTDLRKVEDVSKLKLNLFMSSTILYFGWAEKICSTCSATFCIKFFTAQVHCTCTRTGTYLLTQQPMVLSIS